ncbi:MAG: MbcA/ParS/Xre antitoxin family protein [Chitinophagaceae bacterium]|nr:MbcA/ParS/Xre antitoxin family protein [Chitinophagaceae bacterium]
MQKIVDPTHTLSDLYKLPSAAKIGYIKSGISKFYLVGIKDAINLDYDTLGRILSVSRAKLISKKPEEKFDQLTSERIMLLADVFSYGLDVFEDKDRLTAWLKRPSKALGDKPPIDMMDTLYGIQEVKNELGRIEYGVY